MSIADDRKMRQVFWPLDLGPRFLNQRDSLILIYGWRCSDTHYVVAGAVFLSSPEQLQREREVYDAAVKRKETEGCTLLILKHKFEMVGYLRPNPRRLRFYTVSPLELDVSTEGAVSATTSDVYSCRYRDLEATDFTKPAFRPPDELEVVIPKLNQAWEADRLLQEAQANLGKSISQENGVAHASSPRHNTKSREHLFLTFLRLMLRICNMRLPSLFVHKPLLKDISATVQQLDTRLEQATFLPSQFYVVHRLPRTDMAYSAAQYISFYNCIWLVLNDIIVGVAFGAFLNENAENLGRLLWYYSKVYAVDLIRETLFWLDDWPVGLKLNTELSRFICLSFVGLTGVFEDCLNIVGPHFPLAIYLVGSSGMMGLTMSLSLLSDLLSLLSLPLYLCYMTVTTVFSSQLSAAYSLFNIFRGKRKNILRNRVDSMEYDLDQVLLGTILFTLVAFLFPTILAYYAFFAGIRIAIISIHAVLETSLAFMNHFPLFVLMLRIKDPARLPGGIHFDIIPGKDIPPLRVLKNTPIAFSQIFFQHFLLWSRLSAHYHPIRLLKCLVSGVVISPIPRYSIRYSMIPQQSNSYQPDRDKVKVD
ncbi:Gpi1-domain-containing protein [Calocera cornea HHB12733]|uniref:Gpi1-domain-containing protein n=1 Tax=Calocera cornea HHB12733 TaxID=1353952 RepID=A0A165FND2_9BASI|nr:Gpi1-domain-containing protein [Calocera cornea HHB12733]